MKYAIVLCDGMADLPCPALDGLTPMALAHKPTMDWLAAHGEEADAIYAEELGLQLFPYMDDYACEVRAHLKEKTQKGA